MFATLQNRWQALSMGNQGTYSIRQVRRTYNNLGDPIYEKAARIEGEELPTVAKSKPLHVFRDGS